MSNKVKYIDTKNRTYYFFNDIINIKTFNPNNIKIGKKSYKNILIYWICDDQRLEKCKTLQCKSFLPYFQKSEWII